MDFWLASEKQKLSLSINEGFNSFNSSVSRNTHTVHFAFFNPLSSHVKFIFFSGSPNRKVSRECNTFVGNEYEGGRNDALSTYAIAISCSLDALSFTVIS